MDLVSAADSKGIRTIAIPIPNEHFVIGLAEVEELVSTQPTETVLDVEGVSTANSEGILTITIPVSHQNGIRSQTPRPK